MIKKADIVGESMKMKDYLSALYFTYFNKPYVGNWKLGANGIHFQTFFATFAASHVANCIFTRSIDPQPNLT